MRHPFGKLPRPRPRPRRRGLVAALAAAIVLIAGGGAAFQALTAPRPLTAADLPAHTPDPAHGRWVFYAAGCDGCHAAKGAKGDQKLRLGGGAPLKTPFGTFHPPNISPHPKDGIGSWSDLDFVNAIMRGVSPEGQHYYPALPYLSYQHMRIEDALDLKAFIDTLPPVSGHAPPHDLPFWLFRRAVGVWKRLYMDYRPFRPATLASEQVNRGAYIVNALGHCGECHTPRDMLGGPIRDRSLAGGPSPEGAGHKVPNITPSKDGIGDWSMKDIEDALRTGILPNFDTLGEAMTEVQENLAELSHDDRAAIAAYLKSVPPLPSAPSGG